MGQQGVCQEAIYPTTRGRAGSRMCLARVWEGGASHNAPKLLQTQ